MKAVEEVVFSGQECETLSKVCHYQQVRFELDIFHMDWITLEEKYLQIQMPGESRSKWIFSYL
jgi:hypothetical protein